MHVFITVTDCMGRDLCVNVAHIVAIRPEPAPGGCCMMELVGSPLGFGGWGPRSEYIKESFDMVREKIRVARALA